MLFWAQRPCGALQICLASVCVTYWNTIRWGENIVTASVAETLLEQEGSATHFSGRAIRSPSGLKGRGEKVRFNYSASIFSDFYCMLGLCWPQCLGIDPKISIADYLSNVFNIHTATFFKHAANFIQFPQSHNAPQRQEKKYCHALLLAWRKC